MRKIYLDNIRWITVLLVVIYHVIYMFNGVTTYGVMGPLAAHQPQDLYLYIVYPWFMFLLFVVSGMSARFELEAKGEKGFIKNRTRRYLVPSTVGLLVFWWILGYYSMLMGGAFEAMSAVPKPILFLIMCASGTGPLWYIQMLWLFSVLLMVVRKAEKDKLYLWGRKATSPVLLLMALIVFVAAQIGNMPVITVYRFGIYGLGFYLGYFVFSHDEVMDRLEKRWQLFAALAVCSGAAFVIINWGKSYPDHEVLDTLLCNIYAWFGTLSVLSFMKKWGNFQTSLSKWLCKRSWGIYIFHYLGIAMSAWYLRLYTPQLPAALVYLMVFLSGFGGALALNGVILRIPFLRWSVLGVKKQKTVGGQI